MIELRVFFSSLNSIIWEEYLKINNKYQFITRISINERRLVKSVIRLKCQQ